MTIFRASFLIAVLPVLFDPGHSVRGAEQADLILVHGKIVTADREFSIREAVAVKGDRLITVGSDADVLKCGPNTPVVDLAGKMHYPA